MNMTIASHMTDYITDSALLTMGLSVLALIVVAALYRTWQLRPSLGLEPHPLLEAAAHMLSLIHI